MRNWLKHRKDRIRLHTETYKGQRVVIATCSRHDSRGNLQGYIVQVKAGDIKTGYNRQYFQHGYRFRQVVEEVAMMNYVATKQLR